ncbi:hypothetical protein LBMAG54_13590 [Nitrosopumilaceae archaeon]|nr:hypothetical protein EMGBD3_11830 [Nitrosarchaeum sp.]GDY16503.1 hypothetical protein LBMAG54_13590 [Nitrosopumilaceae archaeon]
MSNTLIYVDIAVGVLGIDGAVIYGTQNQQNHIPSDAIPATEQGSTPSPSGLGPTINKEKWHADPYADEAAAIRARAGK